MNKQGFCFCFWLWYLGSIKLTNGRERVAWSISSFAFQILKQQKDKQSGTAHSTAPVPAGQVTKCGVLFSRSELWSQQVEQ